VQPLFVRDVGLRPGRADPGGEGEPPRGKREQGGCEQSPAVHGRSDRQVGRIVVHTSSYGTEGARFRSAEQEIGAYHAQAWDAGAYVLFHGGASGPAATVTKCTSHSRAEITGRHVAVR